MDAWGNGGEIDSEEMESDNDDERSEGDGMDNWGEDNDEDDDEEEEESGDDAMMSLKMKLLWTNSSVLKCKGGDYDAHFVDALLCLDRSTALP